MHLTLTEITHAAPQVAKQLRADGFDSTHSLAKALADPAMRDVVASRLGLNAEALLQLANRIDLLNVRGIGTIYAELLESAGVDSLTRLAREEPVALHARLRILAQDHDPPVFHSPSLRAVTAWVDQARELDFPRQPAASSKKPSSSETARADN